MTIAELIANMPRIFEYFVPGYLTIFAYRRLKSNNTASMSEALHIGACVVISYLLRNFLKLVWSISLVSKTFSFLTANLFLRCAAISIFGIVVAIIALKLRRNKIIRNLFSKVNSTSLSENIFELCDMDKLPEITACKDKQAVRGRLLSYDLNKDNAWMVLDYFTIAEEGRVIDDWIKNDTYKRCLVSLDKVDKIMVHYKETDPIYPKDFEAEKQKEIKRRNAIINPPRQQ